MNAFVSSSMINILPYIASMAFALGVALAVVISSWFRRDARRFALVLFSEVGWIALFLLEILSPRFESKLLWDLLHWPVILATDANLFLFAFAFARPHAKTMPSVLKVGLWGPVVLSAVLAALVASSALDPDLVYGPMRQSSGLPFSELQYSFSPLTVVFIAWGLALDLAACVLVAYGMRPESRALENGAIFVLLGIAIPALGSVAGLAGLRVFGYRDSAPLWFAAGNVLVAYGLFSRRLFGSVNMARRAVMDALLDPVFVLGEGDEIVDCNAAARILVSHQPGDPIGQSARAVFAEWPSSVTAALDFSEAETELDLPDPGNLSMRSYRITVASSPARDRGGSWKILAFNDITGQKSDARDLAATNEELEFWVKHRTAALRQEVAQRTEAEERLRELNAEMAKTQREILWTLSEVVESRSRETAYHVVRVGEYARILATAYGLPSEEVEIVTTAAPMHDVGKIAVPDAILGKPGLLTPEEREVMKRHTVVGWEILGSSERPLLKAAAVIAFEHHERWDGKGYPLGKAGEAISLSGRIVSLCDVFDALYNKRVYKEAWPLEKVVELVRTESGGAFDPRMVELALAHIDDFMDVSRRYTDEVVETI